MTVHETLAREAFEEREREAEAMMKYLQEKISALRAFERSFIEGLDSPPLFGGGLEWMEDIARVNGFDGV